MLFTRDAVLGLADGSITLTFRTWVKPQAKVAGRYRTCGLLLEVGAISRVDPGSITDAGARRAGSMSADELRKKLGKPSPGTRVWRVEFRCLGPDDRIARRNDATLDTEKLTKLKTRVARLDQAKAWTLKTLELIESKPGVVSTTLARQMNMERPDFKINVRKLKELGLTEGLDVGYQLSPLGKAFLLQLGKRGI